MPAEWTWLLCDGQAEPLAELTSAAGKKVTYRRNTFAEASCTIGAEDEAAVLLGSALRTGWPQLRLYRWAEGATSSRLVFNGYLAPLVATAGEDSTLQIVARSPFSRLVGTSGAGSGVSLIADREYIEYDAAIIAGDLAGNHNVGIELGLGEPTKVRDLFPKQGQNVGEAILGLSSMLDGFDFTERYVEDGHLYRLAYLDCYAHLGVDRPEVRFEYGATTMANLREVTITTAPPANMVLLAGANGLSAYVADQDSMDTWGEWQVTRSFTSIDTQAALDDRAWSLLRPRPIRTVQMVPDPSAPRPFDDFYIADTGYVYVNHGMMQIDTGVRLNAFTVVIDENGLEAAEIEDPLMPDEEAAIRANIEVEVES